MEAYYLSYFLCLLICESFSVGNANEWSFLVIADWHGAERFAIRPGNGTKNYRNKRDRFQYLKQNFGGDLLMLIGDTNTGHWDTDDFIQKLDPTLTASQAVLKAGENCYGTVKNMLSEVGYDRLLAAPGDHELGDNRWNARSSKVMAAPEYRTSFSNAFNKDSEDDFFFPNKYKWFPSRPRRTDFRKTSFAYKHKNAMFVTVDVFKTVGNGDKPFEDRANGIGGHGAVTCTVDGPHLKWFEKVLSMAQNDNSIDHIFVQAHVPILQPVRMVSSSGAFMDFGEESPFYKAMVRYGVDVYFAGEVHATTVRQDSSSNLLQVVSRGNALSSFLKVEVAVDTFSITSYKEVGIKPRGENNNYAIYGKLKVDKGNDTIESTGILSIIDDEQPLIHFNFNETIQLRSSEVIGLKHDAWKTTSLAEKVTIRGIVCDHALPNKGSFGAQYDGQIANVDIEKDSLLGIHGNYGVFTESSMLGIFSSGPIGGGGRTISYSLWFKTSSSDEMVLIHYGSVQKAVHFKKDMFTLTLKDGIPVLYTTLKTRVVPKFQIDPLNDDEWHHLSISMPHNSCLLSEVVFYIDEKWVKSTVSDPKKEQNIFFITDGKIGIGGFAYGSVDYDVKFPNLLPFVGNMDEIYIHGKSLTRADKAIVTKKDKKFEKFVNKRCETISYNYETKPRGVRLPECEEQCVLEVDCLGYAFKRLGKAHKIKVCTLFYDLPTVKKGKYKRSVCAIAIAN